ESAGGTLAAGSPLSGQAYRPSELTFSNLFRYGQVAPATAPDEWYRLRVDDVLESDVGQVNDWFVEARRLRNIANKRPDVSGLSLSDNSGVTSDKIIDFPTGTSATPVRRTFTIKNTTTIDQTFTMHGATGIEDFRIFYSGYGDLDSPSVQERLGTNFDLSLSPGETFAIDVEFRPRSVGAQTCTFNVSFAGATTNLVARGTAVASRIKVTDPLGDPLVPTAADGTRYIGAIDANGSYFYDLLVTNVSTSALPLSSLRATEYPSAFGTGAAWEFESGFIGAPSDGMLQPGQSVTKRLKFYTAANTTSGFSPGGYCGSDGWMTDGSGNTVINGTNFVSTYFTDRVNITDTDSKPTDMVASFASTNLGSGSSFLRFKLKGLGAVTNFAKAGKHPGDFTYTLRNAAGTVVTATSFTIPDGQTWTVDMQFKPTAAGRRGAALTFKFDSEFDGILPMSLAMYGTGVGLPPPAPSNVVLRPVSSTWVDVSWRDNSSSETGFVVQRALNSTFTSGKVELNNQQRLAANTTFYKDAAPMANPPLPNTQYFYRIAAVNAANQVSYSPVVALKTPPRGIGTVRVRAAGTSSLKTVGGTGGATATGVTFAGTYGFTGGGSVAGGFAVSNSNSTDDALFNNYRQASSTIPSFTFSTARAQEGSTIHGAYLLKLYFVEPDSTSYVGKRRFNIVAEDKPIVSGYDVYRSAGNLTRKAVVFSSNIIVTDGRLSLGFNNVPGAGNAILSAVELVPA
ncbi:MAG TPA: malectin domain-containing carbohydrate-binding protein, partial [Tepidisphaeraceae bacterium]